MVAERIGFEMRVRAPHTPHMQIITDMNTLFPDEEFQVNKCNVKHKKDFMNYERFVDKFKLKKTTDDCYTPPVVYDAVVLFVGGLTDIRGREIVRPFCPGGDYVNYDYPDNCIVIDNPPFSLYAKIVRFYLYRKIDFFLFSPHLSFFIDVDCTFIVAGAKITYENGACVNTSFVTNICHGLRVWVCPELKESIEKAQNIESKKLVNNNYPDEVITSATLGKIVHRGVELKINSDDCKYVNNLDGLRSIGKSLYGGGFLLSEKSTRDKVVAEMEAKNRTKIVNKIKLELSDRERRIVDLLNRGSEHVTNS